MTIADPFAPPTDEAQTTQAAATISVPAVAPTVGSVKVAVTPVIDPDVLGTKVRTTFKGGSAYDAPWITVDAVDVKSALEAVTGENAAALAELMVQVQKAGAHFVGLASAKPVVAPGAGSQAVTAPSPSAPPPGATGAPSGETRQCQHGEMQFRSGVGKSNGKVWQAFMCPTPKGTPGQCEAEWLR